MDDTQPSVTDDMYASLMGEVVPGLWIGSIWSVQEVLSSSKRPALQWTIVTVLKSDKLSAYIESTVSDIQKMHPGVQVYREEWKLADQSQSNLLSSRLAEIWCIMDDAVNADKGRHCLVHCAAGVSRSAAVCASWLISRRGFTLQQAMDLVRLVRPNASPNMGFIAGLRALEQCGGDIQQAQARLKR